MSTQHQGEELTDTDKGVNLIKVVSITYLKISL